MAELLVREPRERKPEHWVSLGKSVPAWPLVQGKKHVIYVVSIYLWGGSWSWRQKSTTTPPSVYHDCVGNHVLH